MFPWTPSHRGKRRWRARAKMMRCEVVIWTTWKAPSFLWGDGYDPWSQFATSTVTSDPSTITEDASLRPEEAVEDHERASAWRSLPGTSYGKKSPAAWTLGKDLFLFHLVFQSILNQKRLIENSFEKSFEEEKRNTVERSCADQKGDRNTCFWCVCNTSRTS